MVSCLLSSLGGELGLFLEVSDLLSCGEGILVVPFELVQENQASSQFEGQFGVLLSGTVGFLSRFNR